MGRDVKRVPLDFDWPLEKVWSGYLAPERFNELPCPAGDQCLGGCTPARAWMSQIVHLLLMLYDDLAEQRRGSWRMHPYFDSVPKPWRTNENIMDRLRNPNPAAPRPSADIAELASGLAGRAPGLLGHDAINQWAAENTIIKAAGLDPDVWGVCPQCEGHGSVEAYPGQRGEAESWTRTEPPTGEGWQLWETVSKGSPISPVFPDAESLAQWLTTADACWGAMKRPMTIEQARGFVQVGWAPSGVSNPGGVHDGATYIGTKAALEHQQ
jgi:hypothetical protein